MRVCGWKCRTAVYPVGRVGWALENGCVRASLTRIGCKFLPQDCRRQLPPSAEYRERCSEYVGRDERDVTSLSLSVPSSLSPPSLSPFFFNIEATSGAPCSLAPLDDTATACSNESAMKRLITTQGHRGSLKCFFFRRQAPRRSSRIINLQC
jgi:hypothetical protein